MALKLGSLYVTIGADTDPLKKAEKEVKRVNKSMSRSFSGLGRVIAAAFTVEAARRVIGVADSMALLDVRVKNATKTQREYNKSREQLLRISNATGTALAGNITLFEQLALAAQEVGASNDQVLQLTETFNKLGAIGGSSLEAMRNSQRQFAQAMAGGIVRAEEFNSILENTPFVARAIAQGLGKSTGELRKMVIAGELLSEDVFNALLSQTEDVSNLFETLPVTMDRATQQVANNFAIIIEEINKGVTGTQSLAAQVQDFADVVLTIPNDVRAMFLIVFGELDQFFTWAMAKVELLGLEISGWFDVTAAQKAGTAAQIAEIEKVRDARIAASRAAVDAGIDDEARARGGKLSGSAAIEAAATVAGPAGGGGGSTGPTKAEQSKLARLKNLGETELEEINRQAKERRDLVLSQEQMTWDAKSELLDNIHKEQISKTNEVNQRLLDAEVVAGDRRASLAAAQQQVMLTALSTLGNNVNAIILESGREGTAVAKGVFLAMKAVQVAQIIAATETAAAVASAYVAGAGPIAWLASVQGIRAIGYTSAAMVAGLAVGGGRQFGGSVSPQLAHPINEDGVPEILNQAGRQFLLPNGKGGSVSPLTGGAGGAGQPNVTIISNGTPQTVTGTEMSRGEVTVMIDDAARATERRMTASAATGRGDFARGMQTGFKLERNLR